MAESPPAQECDPSYRWRRWLEGKHRLASSRWGDSGYGSYRQPRRKWHPQCSSPLFAVTSRLFDRPLRTFRSCLHAIDTPLQNQVLARVP